MRDLFFTFSYLFHTFAVHCNVLNANVDILLSNISSENKLQYTANFTNNLNNFTRLEIIHCNKFSK